MKMISEAEYALPELIRSVGIPKHVGAKELTRGTWKQVFRDKPHLGKIGTRWN
jgi:hypothetical protein